MVPLLPQRQQSTAAFGLLAILLISAAGTLQPSAAQAHGKGLYKTRQEAEQRARELGCSGTHQNNGLWMPCSQEAALHEHLRRE